MRRSLLAAVIAAFAVVPAPAVGQGWVRLPDGEAGYTFPYNTTALFSGAMHEVVLGSCSAAPGSVTYTRPTGSFTLSFDGSAGALTATNTGLLASRRVGATASPSQSVARLQVEHVPRR